MSWIKLSLFGGQLKLKPWYQLRTTERMREIPVLNLGPLVISWWNREALEREARLNIVAAAPVAGDEAAEALVSAMAEASNPAGKRSKNATGKNGTAFPD